MRQENGMYSRIKTCYRWKHISPHGLWSADMYGFQLLGWHVGRTEDHQCVSNSLHGGLSEKNVGSLHYSAPRVSFKLEFAKDSLILKKKMKPAVANSECSCAPRTKCGWRWGLLPHWMLGKIVPAVIVQGQALCGAMNYQDDPYTPPTVRKKENGKWLKCCTTGIIHNVPLRFSQKFRYIQQTSVLLPYLPFYVNEKWH